MTCDQELLKGRSELFIGNLRYKLLAVALALALITPILVGCGGDEKEAAGAAPSPPAGQVAALTPNTNHSLRNNRGPVKIGAICAWSGPAAMAGVALADPIIKLVEKQVRDMGGILGGREVKVIKYDSRGSVPEAVAGARKLLYDDKVSALVWGGVSGAEIAAVADFAEENKILYVPSAFRKGYQGEFAVTATTSGEEYIERVVSLVNKVLKPKTVAFLASDGADSRDRVQDWKRRIVEAAGIREVYQQYTTPDTTDFAAYLTKIKYVNPDVLIIDFTIPEAYITIAKQIMELGGWGDIKVVALPPAESAIKLPGVEGWYILAIWSPELPFPGSVKYREEYQAMHGRLPSATQVYFYNSLWTAIYAIDLAGTSTDLRSIAQAARSGKLEWETPIGRAHFTPDGLSGLRLSVGRVEKGKLVLVTSPE